MCGEMRSESTGLAGVQRCRTELPDRDQRSDMGNGDSGAFCGLLMKVLSSGNHTQEQGQTGDAHDFFSSSSRTPESGQSQSTWASRFCRGKRVKVK